MMNTIVKKIIVASLVIFSFSACKKDEESIEPTPANNYTGKVLNGSIKGTVSGFTRQDSTAFEFDFNHIYEESYNKSRWGVPCTACKTSRTAPDEVNIYVERYNGSVQEHSSFIDINRWDLNGGISTGDLEMFIVEYVPLGDGRTMYYYQEVKNNADITVESVEFDKKTGDFSIKMTGVIEEGNTDGSTGNPGVITMEYSGTLYFDETIN